jgi:hypothetical protein
MCHLTIGCWGDLKLLQKKRSTSKQPKKVYFPKGCQSKPHLGTQYNPPPRDPIVVGMWAMWWPCHGFDMWPQMVMWDVPTDRLTDRRVTAWSTPPPPLVLLPMFCWASFSTSSHWVPIRFPICSLGSQCVPKGWFLRFNLICFAQSPPLLTYIVGPKGGGTISFA